MKLAVLGRTGALLSYAFDTEPMCFWHQPSRDSARLPSRQFPHPVAIALFFESEIGFEVCGEAFNGRNAIDAARELNPELIIFDFRCQS